MSLPLSGPISLADIRAEFGGSGATSLGDYYKGSSGGNSFVRNKASNNFGIDQAPNVPASTSLSISFNQFFGAERAYEFPIGSTSPGTYDASFYFGSDYAGSDYKKRFRLTPFGNVTNPPGGDCFLFPSGANGSLEVDNDGTITAVGGFGINNQSSVTVNYSGSGTISGVGADEFNSTFDGNASAKINFIGGGASASGPDIRHSDYGSSGFNCKLTRSGNTFTVSWTYNELDYVNQGAGSYDISSIFPLTGSGRLDYTDTSEYRINANAGSYGRDTRDIAFGSKIISGVRHIWFASTAKSSVLTLGSTMTYNQASGFSVVSLTTSNSRRSDIFTFSAGGATSGSVSGV